MCSSETSSYTESMNYSLYFINNKSAMFATFADRPIVIASPDEKMILSLKKTVDTQKRMQNKWLNKCLRFYDDKGLSILKLSSHPTNKKTQEGVLPTYISKLDIDQQDGIRIINDLYNLCDSEVFMMYEFEQITNGEEYLLTLTGVHITQEDIIHENNNDIAGYLEDLLRMQ